ncbi:MAG: hypothetical protein NTY41_04230 [Proteobacteria bacterium]|nr:hypothetical protein [Pseudomonadota bacterium]
MPITWKKSKNLKPAVILDSIAAIRSVSPGGAPSFSGFSIEDDLPALQSMLDFPEVANEVQRSTLVWKALASISGELTPKTFLAAINDILSKRIATREAQFHILTAISIAPQGLPAQTRIDGSTLKLLSRPYPQKYAERAAAVAARRLPVESTPDDYCRVIVTVTAKSYFGVMTKALRTLDIQRAIWCLMCNFQMEIKGQEWNPINVIRLGSIHTVHNPDGSLASQEVWFEPNFTQARIFRHDRVDMLRKKSMYALRALARCPYRAALTEALLRYVRALDERDQNTAFIRLWGAIEALTSPGFANYDQVVRRCSFLFRDTQYHQQILEHLREYRNQSIHAGDQSDNAKTHCFQLQLYFNHLIWFHLGNVGFFVSLEETNAFLDLAPNKTTLLRSKQLVQKAIRFVS